MASYRSQYEKYYNNINNNPKNKIRYNKFKKNKNSKYIKTERLIKKMILQLSGSLIMLIIFLGLKLLPIKAANDTYIFTKDYITKYQPQLIYLLEKPQIQYFKNKTLECVQEVKSNLGMDKINEEKN